MTLDLMTIDRDNPQPGQQFAVDGTRYTIVGWNEQKQRYDVTQALYAGTPTEITFKNSMGLQAIRNLTTPVTVPELTDFDREMIARDLHFEREAARLEATPTPPMPALAYEWQCLDCGNTWNGRKECPRCGADESEVIHYTGL